MDFCLRACTTSGVSASQAKSCAVSSLKELEDTARTTEREVRNFRQKGLSMSSADPWAYVSEGDLPQLHQYTIIGSVSVINS